jgi:signal transduction histidine kinase
MMPRATVFSKTIVFGVLTVIFVTAYVAVVAGLGMAMGNRSKPNLALSIAATAGVAVLFQPVRTRVERLTNRLVYGGRASPYQILAEFSQRVNRPFATDVLPPQMARTLAEGTGAARAEVWLVIGGVLRRAACWPPQPGTAVALPMLDDNVPAVPNASRTVGVWHNRELLGALTVTARSGVPFTPAEEKLLSDLAAPAGLALRNVRLIEELKASRQRIVAAQDAERRRLERNIHDGAQQRLVMLALALHMACAEPDLPPGVARGLNSAANELTVALTELRDVARGIHPAVLTEEGLAAALLSVAERSSIPATISSVPAVRLPPSVEATVYLIVSRALADATRAHAAAVTVSAHLASGSLVVEISDDGDDLGGYDALDKQRSLLDLADRVATLGGRLDIDRTSNRDGTVVKAVIPCEW